MVAPGRYLLSAGVPAEVSEDARLTLVSVEDSRCPDDVKCIWAGKIEYHFTLESCGRSERFMLGPDARSHAAQIVPDTVISLAPGQPPPRGPAAQQPPRSVEVLIGAN